MSHPSISEQKRALRQAIRAEARAISPAEWASISSSICAQLLRMPAFQAATTVFCFVGVGLEIDTRAFLQRTLSLGKRLCVPLCVQPGEMEARQILDLSELSSGAYGIPEPPSDSIAIPAAAIDFAVIPCLSCTASGQRLGKGGGYYDRFLQRYAGAAVLVCPSRLMSSQLPVEPHDQPISTVLQGAEQGAEPLDPSSRRNGNHD